MYKCIEEHNYHCRIFRRSFWPGIGAERLGVGQYTLNESNKRGDWLKHWLMIQNYAALSTMFRKGPDKQATFRSTCGRDKQLDDVWVGRRRMRHCTDAEANDTIDMGSDHQSVVTHLRLPCTKKSDSQTEKKSGTPIPKSTRFVKQTSNTQESAESISLLEEKFTKKHAQQYPTRQRRTEI